MSTVEEYVEILKLLAKQHVAEQKSCVRNGVLVIRKGSSLRYGLSRLIPVPITAHYEVVSPASSSGTGWLERAHWWQWRNHIYCHSTVRI